MNAVTRRELLRYGIVVLVALVVTPPADAFPTKTQPPRRPRRKRAYHMNIACMVANEPH